MIYVLETNIYYINNNHSSNRSVRTTVKLLIIMRLGHNRVDISVILFTTNNSIPNQMRIRVTIGLNLMRFNWLQQISTNHMS